MYFDVKISTQIVLVLLFLCNAKSVIKWKCIQLCSLHTLSQVLFPVSFGLIINNEFHFFSIYRHIFVSYFDIVYKISNIAFSVLHYIIVNNNDDDVVDNDEKNNEILEAALFKRNKNRSKSRKDYSTTCSV